MTRISESEIIEELQAALDAASAPQDDDCFTTGELSKIMNIGEAAVRRRLRQLTAAGRLEPVRVMRLSLTGTMRQVWGYRLLPDDDHELL